MRPLACITGGSRGIGRAVAAGLAKDGWDLWLLARDSEALSAAAREITSAEPACRIFCSATDIADLSSLERELTKLLGSFPEPELLFNNAAVNERGTVDLSPSQFQSMLAVNVTGAWNILHLLVPLFRERGSGAIFNVSSVAGLTGFPGSGAYCATKFAVRGLSESLFHELSPLGVRVTALCPSWTDTRMSSYAPFAGSEMIPPGDILAAVRFVLSLSPHSLVKELVIHCRSDFQ